MKYSLWFQLLFIGSLVFPFTFHWYRQEHNTPEKLHYNLNNIMLFIITWIISIVLSHIRQKDCGWIRLQFHGHLETLPSTKKHTVLLDCSCMQFRASIAVTPPLLSIVLRGKGTVWVGNNVRGADSLLHLTWVAHGRPIFALPFNFPALKSFGTGSLTTHYTAKILILSISIQLNSRCTTAKERMLIHQDAQEVCVEKAYPVKVK